MGAGFTAAKVLPLFQHLNALQHGKVLMHDIVAMLHVRSAALAELPLELDCPDGRKRQTSFAHQLFRDGTS
jgi:hypothetical protein